MTLPKINWTGVKKMQVNLNLVITNNSGYNKTKIYDFLIAIHNIFLNVPLLSINRVFCLPTFTGHRVILAIRKLLLLV